MKKIKLFLPVLLSLLVIFAISLTACKTGNGSLQSIEITKQPNGTVFPLGEEFSYAGLEVTATYSKSTKILTEDEYVVDASAYNAKEEGTYEIKISYTYEGVTKETSYNVEVRETVYAGLSVELADGYKSNLPYFYLSDIIVKEVDENGVVKEQALDSSEYTIKIYNGAKEFELGGSDVAYLPNGIYQIWAFKDSSIEGYVLKSFAWLTVS